MTVNVNIIDSGLDSPFDIWYDEENQRRDDRDALTAVQIGLQIAQLIFYYDKLDDSIDDRDDKIDDQIDFMQEIEDYKETQDLPMLRCKKDILGLGLPGIDMCGDAIKVSNQSEADGQAINHKADQLAAESCGGVPQGWALHEGSLMAAKAASYVGGIIANASKRRVEDFRVRKTELVRVGQQGMKAVYNANDILAKYAQAASIYSGLTDLYLQGFNSAGAGLGVALGQLGASGTTGGSGGLFTNAGGSFGGTGPGLAGGGSFGAGGPGFGVSGSTGGGNL